MGGAAAAANHRATGYIFTICRSLVDWQFGQGFIAWSRDDDDDDEDDDLDWTGVELSFILREKYMERGRAQPQLLLLFAIQQFPAEFRCLNIEIYYTPHRYRISVGQSSPRRYRLYVAYSKALHSKSPASSTTNTATGPWSQPAIHRNRHSCDHRILNCCCLVGGYIDNIILWGPNQTRGS